MEVAEGADLRRGRQSFVMAIGFAAAVRCLRLINARPGQKPTRSPVMWDFLNAWGTMMLEPRTVRSHRFVRFVAVVVLASAPARPQVQHQHEPSDQVDHSSAASAASFDEMMHEAMTRMDSGMSIRHSGNPDRDFAAMMIPHHQGAIDMAKVELQFGRDPVLRRLAQGIIVEQQQEVELMRRQLQRLSPPPLRKEK